MGTKSGDLARGGAPWVVGRVGVAGAPRAMGPPIVVPTKSVPRWGPPTQGWSDSDKGEGGVQPTGTRPV